MNIKKSVCACRQVYHAPKVEMTECVVESGFATTGLTEAYRKDDESEF